MKRKLQSSWLNLLTTSYLILTLALGLYSFFHLALPTTIIIFFCEITYLIIGLLFTIVILVKINLFLAKIKRTNFQLMPLKIQFHSVTMCALILWAALVLVYGTQSAWTLFTDSPLISPSFLDRELFNNLLAAQFSLTIYLLMAMVMIFVYALILHCRKEIKIIPDNFWAFELAQFQGFTSFGHPIKVLFFFFNYLELQLYALTAEMIVLALRLNHLKALALRQFKKKTTPPTLFYSYSI